MRIQRIIPFLLIPLLAWNVGRVQAQDVTASISQVIPFASTGMVTTVDGKEKPISASASANTTGSTNATTAAFMAQTGGKISTGADGATSLILGGTGTARMQADSEVRVPAATEKSHSLEMLKGRLFMNIRADDLKKRASGEFRLKTPAALLAVKGTKFFAITQDGADIIGVHEGEVVVTTPDGKSSASQRDRHRQR